MFASRDLLGAHNQLAQGLAAGVAAALALALGLTVIPLEMLPLIAVLPVCAVLALRKPFVFVVVFVAFSYFRLHEAYPFLVPLKILLITSAASLGGMIAQAFFAKRSAGQYFRELKTLALVTGCGAVALGFIFGMAKLSMSNPGHAAIGSFLILLAAGAMLIWRHFLESAMTPGWPVEMKLFAIFFAITTVGVMFAFDRNAAFGYWALSFSKVAMMTLAIAWLARTPGDFALATWAIVISGVLIAFVAIYNKLNGIGLVEGTRVTIPLPEILIPKDAKPDDISGGVLGDPNDLALVLLFPLSFAMAIVVTERARFAGIVCLIVTGLLLLAIIYTQSRGGLLGFLAAAGIIGLRVIKSKLLLGVLGLMASAFLVVAMDIGNRASGGYAELSGSGIDESANGRLHAWLAAIRMVLDAPLTGVGINNFTSQFFFYSDFWDGKNKAVHSTWFGVLAETGVPGIVVFVMMYVATVFSAWRSLDALEAAGGSRRMRAVALGLFSGVVGFGAAGTFLTQGFTWPLYIQLALIAALARYVAQHATPEHAERFQRGVAQSKGSLR